MADCAGEGRLIGIRLKLVQCQHARIGDVGFCEERLVAIAQLLQAIGLTEFSVPSRSP